MIKWNFELLFYQRIHSGCERIIELLLHELQIPRVRNVRETEFYRTSTLIHEVVAFGRIINETDNEMHMRT